MPPRKTINEQTGEITWIEPRLLVGLREAQMNVLRRLPAIVNGILDDAEDKSISPGQRQNAALIALKLGQEFTRWSAESMGTADPMKAGIERAIEQMNRVELQEFLATLNGAPSPTLESLDPTPPTDPAPSPFPPE